VFILSRIREAHDRGLQTEDAVARGIKTSAGTVTSAALVMVGAFSIFATLPILEMKEMGIGLAAAVLIDATIVRAMLLPATIRLLGERSWYFPRWLSWLPRLEGVGSTGRLVTHAPRSVMSLRRLKTSSLPWFALAGVSFVLGAFVLGGGLQEVALPGALFVFLGGCIRGAGLAVRDDEVSSRSIRGPGARTLAIIGADSATARRQRRLERTRRSDSSH
jgi:uncharacterized membrane protein YdfJ with MMPL/SSD domain